MRHKFAVGQLVEYHAVDALAGGAGLYTILRLLPEDAGEFQYHVQRTSGREQRRVRESLLRVGIRSLKEGEKHHDPVPGRASARA
jgi:hypothetical protein